MKKPRVITRSMKTRSKIKSKLRQTNKKYKKIIIHNAIESK